MRPKPTHPIAAGCSCDPAAEPPFPLQVRWDTGLISSPRYVQLRADRFLAALHSIKHLCPPRGREISRVLGSLLLIGVPVPIVVIESGIPQLDKNLPPSLPAVNVQWRQIMATCSQIPFRTTLGLHWKATTTKEFGEYLVTASVPRPGFAVLPHEQCPTCSTGTCAVLSAPAETSFLEAYQHDFFGPLTSLIDLALSKGHGVGSDYTDLSEGDRGAIPNAVRMGPFA